MVIYFLTFLLAFLITYFVTPIIKKIAVKINAVDLPGDRKIHAFPIPRLGGVAIWAGFIIAISCAYFLAGFFGINLNPKVGLGITLGGTLLVLAGIWDDIRPLRPLTKLFWQIAAAILLIGFGLEISFVSNPFNGILAIGFLAIPLTLFWVVGLTNAINLIDGLDGLAAGVTAISAFSLFFVAVRTHQLSAAILMLALAGTALGFIRYNFFPAKIFLGDSGSMFLGFVLAVASIVGVFKTTLVVALFVPILVLGVPIFDTLFAIVRRLQAGKNPFEADNKHIHHMLLRAGFNQREAVFAIYIVCFILSLAALVMAL
ncbi:undecaprenyl/decaprenyl-phosphate alpha-N-acetylglucosaminyl 1-phosphate transferase [Candidatus Saganbacteria bacterium]|nr:undecaprenyl/decaprenyl-phosphate alpha-N-acetylglucosaminyl 1-phosphate transferase [Candidatus Saganbacteria bacterium]